MAAQRNQYGPEFKVRVALEALKEQQTLENAPRKWISKE
jgi:hypothetical protein